MDTQSIASRLREALSRSAAPYPMACVVVGGNGVGYSGYNLEPASGDPVHAEDMALGQLPSGVRAMAVHIISSTDGIDGMIRAIPCRNCLGRLETHAAPDVPVFLYSKGAAQVASFNLGDLVKASRPRSSVTRIKLAGIDSLPLDPLDAATLKALVRYVRATGEKVTLCLTGSASGVGGVREFVGKSLRGSYRDLDLVIIGTPSQLEMLSLLRGGSQIYALAGHTVPLTVLTAPEHFDHYAWSKKGTRLVYVPTPRVQAYREPDYVRDPQFPAVLDISFGNRIDDVMSEEYLNKHWYVQLLTA